ncbi:hypothetical protein BH20ACT5_BH20ACT5_03110 [soil metagenome]
MITLPLALRLDAVASGALGVLAAAAAGPLADPLGLPVAFLLPIGIFLIGYAAALLVIAGGLPATRSWVPVVIAGNLLWVLASVLLVLAGPFELTTLGTVVIVAQAVAVAVFAELQFSGLRRRTVSV